MKLSPRFGIVGWQTVALGALTLASCSGPAFNGGGGGASSEAAGAGGGAGGETTFDEGGVSGEGGEGPADDGAAGGQAGAGSGGLGGLAGAIGLGGITGHGGIAGTGPVGVKAWDDFVASAEGWTITGDDVTKVPKYSSVDGNPNGQISATDGSDGLFFFTAPQKYLGDASAFYGGTLRFDLKAELDSSYLYDDVQLAGAGITLAYDCTPAPGVTWTTYTVPLSEVGWKVNSLKGVAATRAQFEKVLGDLTRLRIRGEFKNGLNDTAWLDNVYLGAK